ncbi:Integral membrane protein [Bacillus cereus AH676]|nr:Integral membrane protein [Bacillus cereus AH676]
MFLVKQNKKKGGNTRMTRNFKKAALNSLDGKWGLGIGVSALFYFVPTLSASAIAFFMYLIFVLFIGIIGPDALFIYSIGGEPQVDPVALAVLILSYIGLWVVCFLIYSVIQGIFNYGYSVFTLHLGKQEEVKVDDIFSGFKKKNLFKSIKLGLMQAIFLFLWSLLLIVPGIIKYFSYSMSYYILVENPDYTASEALRESKRIMKGQKLKLFVLWLSFIGWFLLAAFIGMFTFNLSFIFISPYYNTTVSHFYLDLIKKQDIGEAKVSI